MDQITGERRVNHKPWEQLVIWLFELVINHNQSTHGQNMSINDDIAPPWMKFYDNSFMLLDERSVMFNSLCIFIEYFSRT